MGSSGSVEVKQQQHGEWDEDLELKSILNKVKGHDHQPEEQTIKHKRYRSESDIQAKYPDMNRERTSYSDTITRSSEQKNIKLPTINKRSRSEGPDDRPRSRYFLSSPTGVTPQRTPTSRSTRLDKERSMNSGRYTPHSSIASSVIHECDDDINDIGWDGRTRIKSSRSSHLLRWLEQSNNNVGDESLSINLDDNYMLPEVDPTAQLTSNRGSVLSHSRPSTHQSYISNTDSEILPSLTHKKRFLSQGLQALHNKEHLKYSPRFSYKVSGNVIDEENNEDMDETDGKNRSQVVSRVSSTSVHSRVQQRKQLLSTSSDPISRGSTMVRGSTPQHGGSAVKRGFTPSHGSTMTRGSPPSKTLSIDRDQDSGIESKLSDYRGSSINSRAVTPVKQRSRSNEHTNQPIINHRAKVRTKQINNTDEQGTKSIADILLAKRIETNQKKQKDSHSNTETDDTETDDSGSSRSDTYNDQLSGTDIELFKKIKHMGDKNDLSKNEFDEVIQGYLTKKKKEEKPEEQQKEEEVKQAAAVLVENLHKDKNQINDLRGAERNKVEEKLRRRLEAKRQIKAMVQKLCNGAETKQQVDDSTSAIDDVT